MNETDKKRDPLNYFAAEVRQREADGMQEQEALGGALKAYYIGRAKTICRDSGAHFHKIYADLEGVDRWVYGTTEDIGAYQSMDDLDAEIIRLVKDDIEGAREYSGFNLIEDLEEAAGAPVRISGEMLGLKRGLIRRGVTLFLRGDYEEADEEQQESNRANRAGTGYAVGWYESQSWQRYEVEPCFAVIGYYHGGRLSYIDVMRYSEYLAEYKEDHEQHGTMPAPCSGMGIARIHVPGEPYKDLSAWTED